MNEQAIKQIGMAKVAIKSNDEVVESLKHAKDFLWGAMCFLAEGVGPLEMLKVTKETIAIGAINQLYENVSLLLAE